MIKRIFIFMMLGLMAIIFINLAANYSENTELSRLGHYYADRGPQELGAPNLVTAVVVTYRGLDTLGEVTVLFISAAGVGLLLRRTRAYTSRPAKSSKPQPNCCCRWSYCSASTCS